MLRMRVLHVVGARPNFMKASPVYRALALKGVEQSIVHTGQHYDTSMSDVFFRDLDLPPPNINLNAGSGSHAQQTATIMSRLEPLLLLRKPDIVLVYGDVNSTVAAALVCSKLGIRIGHVEAGLRSFDRSMPEEINRLVTDQLADMLFTPSQDANENLDREGIQKEKVFLVGNVMIDTLVRLLPQAETIYPAMKSALKLSSYGLVTIHRPSNVDNEASFVSLLGVLQELSNDLPLIFPVHPRARRLWSEHLRPNNGSFRIREALGYLEFLALQMHSQIVITDSGGVQEESTFLGVPCLTLRENTERPITVSYGTNTLIGRDLDLLRCEFKRFAFTSRENTTPPPLWDGKAALRIADILAGESCSVISTACA